MRWSAQQVVQSMDEVPTFLGPLSSGGGHPIEIGVGIWDEFAATGVIPVQVQAQGRGGPRTGVRLG